MKHFIVHIGHGKTGSTSIQHTLKANLSRLEEAGVLYEVSSFNHGPLKTLVGGSNKLSKAKNKAECRQILDRLNARIDDFDYILLSCEGFASLGVEKVEKLLDMIWPKARTISYIFYIRDPKDHYKSQLQQTIKTSARVKSPQEFTSVMAQRAQEFGAAGRLYLNKFDRKYLVDGDVVTDFETCLSKIVGKRIIFEKFNDKNTSLSAEQTIFLQKLRSHKTIFSNGVRHPISHNFKLLFTEMNSEKMLGSKLDVTDAVKRAAHKANESFYDRMASIAPSMNWAPPPSGSDEGAGEDPEDKFWRLKDIVKAYDQELLNDLNSLLPGDFETMKIKSLGQSLRDFDSLIEKYEITNGVKTLKRFHLGAYREFSMISKNPIKSRFFGICAKLYSLGA